MNLYDRITIAQGDITTYDVDAIVNAASESLLGGGGVDGAIHAAAGPQLTQECRALGGCAPGEAKLTQGYNLPARWVIHTVGPIWKGGDRGEADVLRQCYANSLALAAERGFGSIAFPNISTGVYNFPRELAASLSLETARDFFDNTPVPEDVLEEIVFVCFNDESYRCYLRAVEEILD